MKTILLVAYIELCKIRIALLSSFSAATGFLLAATELRSQVIILILGVFLLACGSSALNQYQERETDAAMPRTCSRPLPSGRIKPVNALYFSLCAIIFRIFNPSSDRGPCQLPCSACLQLPGITAFIPSSRGRPHLPLSRGP